MWRKFFEALGVGVEGLWWGERIAFVGRGGQRGADQSGVVALTFV